MTPAGQADGARDTSGDPGEAAGGPSGEWQQANQRYLVAALDVLGHLLAGTPDEPGPAVDDAGLERAIRRRDEARGAMPAPPALEAIADGLDMSAFERDVLLMCAGVELDSAFARICAGAQGDPARAYATFGLGLARLPGAHWSAIGPAGPLRRWHLVRLTEPDVPTTSPLRVDERILHALAGISYLDPRIEPLTEPLTGALSGPRRLPPALRTAAREVADRWSGRLAPAERVLLHGRRRGDLRSAAAAACVELGMRPVCLRASSLPQDPAERDLLARLCERETVLDGVAWVIDAEDTDPSAGRLALDMAGRIEAPVVVTAGEPMSAYGGIRPAHVEVGDDGTADLRTAWRDALGPAATALSGWVDRAAGQFALDLDTVRAVAGALPPIGDEGETDPDVAGAALWDACRRWSRTGLDGLAERITPRARWEDLVLPATHMDVLKQIVAHVRHRHTVISDWGFGARTGRGLGAAALFAGPSGTGKTLAAEVVAGALRLDLYRVDLSQVVSKYIGETEKNLRRVFDAAEAGGAVLLFDEADALFGRRSEVKDSHDRYANIEVGYLLQRVEAYRGVAILTTNLKDTLDPAFLRRLRFVVQFPFPDAEARTRIWRRSFPEAAPTEGLDLPALARLSVSGGTIRNIALSAAFLAADEGEPVRMAHLLAATRTEYTKLERPLTGTEVAGWTS
ncbi:ATP-binding protein [Microbispora sp. NPDC049125]|uniref:ATP-binding protein n=1 Tax=Microbispora sp. NPDC049125 TaxID=3154929 RepID=UPI003467B7F1